MGPSGAAADDDATEARMRPTRRDRIQARDERVLAVEAGQVVCPRRGIVDLEDCFVCRSYRGLRDGHVEGLVCAGDEDAGFTWFLPQV
jgi:hypothetical protein